jgi:hypothetical protein
VNYKHIVALTLTVAVLGYATGRYLQPAEIQIKEREVIKRDVVIVERKITKPDGTIVEEKTTSDKSKIENEKQSKTTNRANYLISANVSTDFKTEHPMYAVSISKRFVGPLFVGATVNTKKELGLLLTLEF